MNRILIFSLACLLSNATLADDGTQRLEKKNLESITQNGELFLEDVTVRQEVKVNGLLEAKKSKLNHVTSHGSADIDHCQIAGNITAHGEANIEDSYVKGHVNLMGDSKLEDSTFEGTITIQGKASFDDNTFNEKVKVLGALKISESTFNKTLTVDASQLKIKASTIHGDLIIKKHPYNKEQHVEIIESTINGNVQFESGAGLMTQDKKSMIKGKVTGGQITSKD